MRVLFSDIGINYFHGDINNVTTRDLDSLNVTGVKSNDIKWLS